MASAQQTVYKPKTRKEFEKIWFPDFVENMKRILEAKHATCTDSEKIFYYSVIDAEKWSEVVAALVSEDPQADDWREEVELMRYKSLCKYNLEHCKKWSIPFTDSEHLICTPRSCGVKGEKCCKRVFQSSSDSEPDDS